MADSGSSNRGGGKSWWNLMAGRARNVVQAGNIHGDVIFSVFGRRSAEKAETGSSPRSYRRVDTVRVHTLPPSKPSTWSTKVKRSLAVSHDGSQIAIGDSAGRIAVLRPGDSEVRTLHLDGRADDGNGDYPSFLCYMPSDDAIVATHPFGIWDVATGKQGATFVERDKAEIPFAVAASPDGQFVATACLARYWSSGSVRSIVRIFDLFAEREIRSVTVKEVVFGMRLDPPSYLWLTGTRRIHLWDYSAAGKLMTCHVFNYRSFTDPIRHMNTPVWEFGTIYGFDVRASRLTSGNWGVFACWDRVARLGMSDDGTDYFPELPHDGPVYDAVLDDEGVLAATASRDGTARVFNVATRREIGRVLHKGPVTAVRFLPGTSDVVSVGVDGTVRISSVT